MAKLLVANHVTLDGVMQAPARPEEDTRDGFAHGGWRVSRTDELKTAKNSAMDAVCSQPVNPRSWSSSTP